MENTIHFTVLVVLIKAIYAQEIEDAALRQMLSKTTLAQCMTPPKLAGAPQRCCNVPQLFENETTVGCEPINLLEGKPALRGSPDCADRNCVLRNNDLLNDNDQIDKESLNSILMSGCRRGKSSCLPLKRSKKIVLVRSLCLDPRLGVKRTN
ncbi:uncharacterized protein LOC125229283 [Leguminivora glycinivorella]|uniref:uncharacterized protein LOC125229283 n=1 Tax=Leguminivora glycinivorella TaxID=1035111 RepID=UPI00200F7C58|nr:uncharacterized protein LOC125229283 [Leguminivora glycinivorella]